MICTTVIPSNVVCWTVSPNRNVKYFGGVLLTNGDTNADNTGLLLNSGAIWVVRSRPKTPVMTVLAAHNWATSILFASDGAPTNVGFNVAGTGGVAGDPKR
ncbi:Uncharacterised protein [Mycobacterium tuberculosis]|nr:Uncharacterised protein [Mycobacterium tuberculosis]